MCLPPSGSEFPIGKNKVVCAAMDDKGKIAACSFTVTINGMLARTYFKMAFINKFYVVLKVCVIFVLSLSITF